MPRLSRFFAPGSLRQRRGGEVDLARVAVGALALAFVALCTWTSYARWASYGYRTFDVAYYVQALWQLIHGRFDVSVQYVPLLGNHVEPIVLLFAPLFAVFPHPMVFVAIQNAGLAAMGPIGYDAARRLGLTRTGAAAAASTLLLMPATAYIALHEFHPEALAAPLLLLLLRARLLKSLRQHWVWFLAVLACKENMALLLVAYCGVQTLAERRAGLRHVRAWYLAPLLVALGWFLFANKVITPLLNSGNIDYLALYQRLGETPGEIVLNALRQPGILAWQFWQGLTGGNLVAGLLLPLLALPCLRPKWLIISSPIFLQHLLSWRSSEWTIYFHYAAPLVPLLWFAAAEACAWLRKWFVPLLALSACVVAQYVLGPAAETARTISAFDRSAPEIVAKDYFLSHIPLQASVVAPLPYLSHLATRRELHSLHYILKGLKTLSRERFDPPPATEFVFIDYRDDATFDATAGYYHPAMRTTKGDVVPSSDMLLHEFLRAASWESTAVDELTLLRRVTSSESHPAVPAEELLDLGAGNKLLAITRSPESIVSGDSAQVLELRMSWNFAPARSVFPWLELHVVHTATGARHIFTRGLCAPQAAAGVAEDRWQSRRILELPPGTYALEAHFFDQPKRVWSKKPVEGSLGAPLSLGTLRIHRANGLGVAP